MTQLVPLPRPEDVGLGKLLFELVPDAITIADVDAGRVVLANPAADKLFGASPADLVGRRLALLVPESARERVASNLQRLRTGKLKLPPGLFAREVLRADGQIRHIEATATLFESEATGRLYLLTLARDVTEQRNIAAALHRSEKRFRALVEHGYDVITLVDGEGVVRYCSPSLERALGYPSDEFVGLDLLSRFHPDDSADIRASLADLLQHPGGRVTREGRLRHRDGTWRVFEAVGTNLLTDPDIQAIVINSRDITQRRQAEAALRDSEECWRHLAEATSEGVLIHRNCRIQEVNRAAGGLFGIPPEQLVGRAILELTESEPASRRTMRRQALTRDPNTWEAVCVRSDGARFPAELHGRPIRYKGKSAHIISVRNISERARADRRGTVLAGLARELVLSDAPEVLQTLANAVAKVFAGAEVGIFRWDLAQAVLVPAASISLAEGSHLEALEPAQGVAGRVALSRAPVCVNDYQQEIGSVQPAAPGLCAAIGAPLLYDERLIGVVAVGSFRESSSFSADDVQLLQEIADLAATMLVGLEHSRVGGARAMLERLHSELDNELTALARDTQAVLAAPSLPAEIRASADEALSAATRAGASLRHLSEQLSSPGLDDPDSKVV